VFGKAVTHNKTTPYDQALPEMIAIFKHRQAGQTWTSQWQRFTMGNAFLKQVYDLPSSFLLV